MGIDGISRIESPGNLINLNIFCKIQFHQQSRKIRRPSGNRVDKSIKKKKISDSMKLKIVYEEKISTSWPNRR